MLSSDDDSSTDSMIDLNAESDRLRAEEDAALEEEEDDDETQIIYPPKKAAVTMDEDTCDIVCGHDKECIAASARGRKAHCSDDEKENAQPRLPPIQLNDELEDEEAAVEKPKAAPRKVTRKDLSQKPCWPQLKTLIIVHPDLVIKMLQACDECKVADCLKAFDNNNVKGNAWARALEVLFVGDRGALAGQIPPMHKPTKFKQKMLDIMKWVKANKDNGDLQIEVEELALDLLERHEAAIEKNCREVLNEKQTSDKLEKDMESHERGAGALPPGARGDTGQGRIAHSTNLAVGNPACFGFAHHTTGTSAEDSVAIEAVAETPSSKKQRESRSKSPAGSTKSNGTAAADLQNMSGLFQQVVTGMIGNKVPVGGSHQDEVSVMTPDDRLNKIKMENLKSAKANLMETIRFLKEIGASQQSVDAKIVELQEVSEKIHSSLTAEPTSK